MFKHKKEEVEIKKDVETQNLASDNKPPVLDAKTEEAKPEDLRDLIEKNIKWTQVVYEQNRKIKNRLNLMVLGSYIRLALVLVPLILAAIFLPPLFKQWFSQYGDLLQGFGIGGDAVKNGASVDPTQLQDILQNILKGR